MTATFQLTPSELSRVDAARRHVHDTVCRPTINRHAWFPCMNCPRVRGTLLALQSLDLRPRDAQGAREVLHDGLCASGCAGAARAHHAKRHSAVVAALRKFRAGEQDLTPR